MLVARDQNQMALQSERRDPRSLPGTGVPARFTGTKKTGIALCGFALGRQHADREPRPQPP